MGPPRGSTQQPGGYLSFRLSGLDAATRHPRWHGCAPVVRISPLCEANLDGVEPAAPGRQTHLLAKHRTGRLGAAISSTADLAPPLPALHPRRPPVRCLVHGRPPVAAGDRTCAPPSPSTSPGRPRAARQPRLRPEQPRGRVRRRHATAPSLTVGDCCEAISARESTGLGELVRAP